MRKWWLGYSLITQKYRGTHQEASTWGFGWGEIMLTPLKPLTV